MVEQSEVANQDGTALNNQIDNNNEESMKPEFLQNNDSPIQKKSKTSSKRSSHNGPVSSMETSLKE